MHSPLADCLDLLPSGWRWTKLREVADFVMGQAPPGDQTNFEVRGTVFVKAGEFGALRPITREWTMKPLKFAKTGDVLICVVGATSGKLNLAIDCAIGRSVAAIRPHKETFDRFIYFQLVPKVLGLRAGTAGSAQGVISKNVLAEIDFVLPPLDEQHRIVAEIEKQFTRLDAGVASLKRVKAALKRYRTSVLRAACEGRLVPTEAELARKQGRSYEHAAKLLARSLSERRKNWNGRGKYKEPASQESDALPSVPEGWIWASVEQLSSKVVDGVHMKPDYVPSGVPFVTVRNLTAGPGISFEKLNHITVDDHLEFIKRAHPEPEDILISKDGTLGVVRVIRTHVEFSIFVSVALVKPVLRKMSSYLGIALSSPQVQVQMVPKGSGLQHIHLEDLRKDCIPLPPLAEQHRIVSEVERRLSVIEEVEAAVEANLKRAERLRQAVLHSAFSGSF